MCLSTSQIGYSWLMHPNTLPPAYINFLNRHGGAEVCKYRAVQARGNFELVAPRCVVSFWKCVSCLLNDRIAVHVVDSY